MHSVNSIRRIVTGEREGKSFVARDDHIQAITIENAPGWTFNRTYGTPAFVLPNDGATAAIHPHYPNAGGAAVVFLTVPPMDEQVAEAPPNLEALVAEFQTKLPGMLDAMEPGESMMHKSDTIDVVTVLSGRLFLVLDDDENRLLSAGDVVIQNGTRHAWTNPFDEPAILQAVMFGVERRLEEH